LFLPSSPTVETIRSFLAKQSDSDFSYVDVGATATKPPSDFDVDHNRICLGHGEAAFLRARRALLSWKMFDIGWAHLCFPDACVQVGTTVAILARHFGFYSLNAAKIVYVVDESEPIARFGFAYGTLKDHIECGEERFLVEWNRNDDSVWYDILAFSRPQHFLVKLAYPVGRLMQYRFGVSSKAAMVQAVSVDNSSNV
jgi:uncharacterized protein (UPF0548 family)